QANSGDSSTMKNEPRKVSEPAVCGTRTTSRKQATTIAATSSQIMARASPRASRSLAFNATIISTGAAAIMNKDQGRVPLASLTSDGNMSLVISRSVKVTHDPNVCSYRVKNTSTPRIITSSETIC